MPLATLVLVLALMAWQPSSVSVSVPAFPTAPVVVDNRNGTVTIIGTGDSYWHIALQPAGAGATTYVHPDVPASERVYTPPSSKPCVAVQAQSGGTGKSDGQLGDWSGFTCATTPGHPGNHTIIGTNDAGGWGPTAASIILGGHITWARAEPDQESTATDVREGFHVLQIVGNPNDETPLSSVNVATYGATVVSDVTTDPGASLLEAGNEMYLKGGVCDPARYGRLYLAGLNALRRARIRTRYLFNMEGSTGNCRDETSSEWLRAALAANPGLGTALVQNGVSTHPYGRAGENAGGSEGTGAVRAQETLLQRQLGAIPPVYITEFGYNTCDPGYPVSASSNIDAAEKLQAAYAVLLGDPNIKGIWYFQSHDYGTKNCWGFMNDNNTTRPQFKALSKLAISQGQ